MPKTTFRDFDVVELFTEELLPDDTMRICREAIETVAIKHIGLLRLVELYAEENGLIASEDDLSQRFDNMLHELGIDHEDSPAFSEHFNNWADALCKEGDIHGVQYHYYCYTGSNELAR